MPFAPSMASSLIGLPPMRNLAPAAATTGSHNGGLNVNGGTQGGTQLLSAPALPSTMTTYYIRKTGSNNNSGCSPGASPDRTGNDGVANGTTTFTAASGNFTQADVGKSINVTSGARGVFKIMAVGSSTSITLSAACSTGSSLTWNIGGALQTVTYLWSTVGANAIQGGDRIYIGAGTYRETPSSNQFTVTNGVRVEVVGDVDGSQTGDPGMVLLSAYTSGDNANPSGGSIFQLSAVNKGFINFRNLFLVGGPGNAFSQSLATQVSMFNCCLFSPTSSSPLSLSVSAVNPCALLFDQCDFISAIATPASIGCNLSQGSDTDMQVEFRNCRLLTGNQTAIAASTGGTGAARPGGMRVRNCLFWASTGCSLANVNYSITVPTVITGSVFYTFSGISMNAGAQVVEDYNLFHCSTARTSCPVGAHSGQRAGQVFPIAMLSFGQEGTWGAVVRMFGEPMDGSQQIGWAQNDLGFDWRPGVPRARGPNAAGALERANMAKQETSTVRTGTNSVRIDGGGIHDWELPVDATTTTVSVYLQRDATYVGAMPQLAVVNGSQCGVPITVAPMLGPTGVWEQVTCVFAPSAKGIVTIRVLSYDQSGAGHLFADDFTVG